MSDITVAPFPTDNVLTAISVAYRNEKMIADEVLPRVPVGSKTFKYNKYALEDNFTIPNTKVGRKSAPTEVEFGHSDESSSVVDYGIDEVVPNDDIATAPVGHDPLARATVSVTDLVLLDREKRVAELVFNAASYDDKHKATLSGAAQFSNSESDPIKYVLEKLDSCIMRPNIMVMGRAVWTKLRTHPKIVKAAHGNSGDSGVAARQAVADLLELDELLIGEGWYNSAKKGQKAATTRLWGNHIALIYRDKLADPRGRVTFGFTAQFGDRVAGHIPEPKIGLSGSIRVRAGERVRELITAPDLGYLIQNAVA
jgi:hypothetical protein